MNGHASAGAALVIFGFALVGIGFSGLVSLGVAVQGSPQVAQITMPGSVICEAGGSCSFNGVYTVNGVGSAGSTFTDWSLSYGGGASVTDTTAGGQFTVDLPPQPGGTTGTFTLPVPGSTQSASTSITWSSSGTSQTYTVTVLFGSTPVEGATVTFAILTNGARLGIAQTDANGVATFQAPYAIAGTYYAVAQEFCGIGNVPTSNTEPFEATNSLTLSVSEICSVSTTTQTVSTTTSVSTSVGSNGQTTTVTTTVTGTAGAQTQTLTVTTSATVTSTVGANGQTTTLTTTVTKTHTSGGSGSGGPNYGLMAGGIIAAAVGLVLLAKEGAEV